jgi:hypothetical protein
LLGTQHIGRLLLLVVVPLFWWGSKSEIARVAGLGLIVGMGDGK